MQHQDFLGFIHTGVRSYITLGIVTLIIILISSHKSRDEKQKDDSQDGKRKRVSKVKLKKGRRNKTKSMKTKSDTRKKDNQAHTNPPLIIAMDCEMVGIGRRGTISMLARCSLVTIQQDDNGNEIIVCIYDKYVKPRRNITDYRTEWSGITADHLQSHEAITFEVCQSQVRNILKCTEDRPVLLVGHALKNDFEVLQLWHPEKYIRDTAFYKPLMRPVRKKLYSQKLRHLVQEHLGVMIQHHKKRDSPSIHVHINYQDENISTSEHHLGHSSIEDASAALLLYRKFEKEWEASLAIK